MMTPRRRHTSRLSSLWKPRYCIPMTQQGQGSCLYKVAMVDCLVEHSTALCWERPRQPVGRHRTIAAFMVAFSRLWAVSEVDHQGSPCHEAAYAEMGH